MGCWTVARRHREAGAMVSFPSTHHHFAHLLFALAHDIQCRCEFRKLVSQRDIETPSGRIIAPLGVQDRLFLSAHQRYIWGARRVKHHDPRRLLVTSFRPDLLSETTVHPAGKVYSRSCSDATT